MSHLSSRSSTILDPDFLILIDVLLYSDDHAALLRRKRKKLGSEACFFVSPEDFILQKLKVGRPKDFEDAVVVLKRQGKKLDKAYLKKWARKLAVSEELNYVLGL